MNRRTFISGCFCAALIPFLLKQSTTTNIEGDYDYINYLEVHLADHCNLNCKYCWHFSSISDKHFYDLKQFKKDIKRIAHLTNKKLYTLRFMGGEPLLNPDVCKYVDIAKFYLPKTSLRILTNGTLLPEMNDEFWKNMSRNKVTIDVSIYDVDIDWKKVIHKASVFGVDINTKVMVLVKKFLNLNLDLKGSLTDFTKCKTCYNGQCYNLLDGKIYECPIIAFVKYFNKRFDQNLEVVEGDYIDIYKAKSLYDIHKWMKQPKPFCRYCDDMISVNWEASDIHTIDEWAHS